MAERIEIALTNRRPVEIDPDQWPIIARAKRDKYDSHIRCQSNRDSHWRLTVRQKGDKALVYASYEYSSNWQGEESFSQYAGRLDTVSQDNPLEVIIAQVCVDIEDMRHNGADAEVWPELRRECVANLPAETL